MSGSPTRYEAICQTGRDFFLGRARRARVRRRPGRTRIMMAKLAKVSLCGVVALTAGLALSTQVFAQAITGASATKNAGNSADDFQDGLTSSFQRTSTAS